MSFAAVGIGAGVSGCRSDLDPAIDDERLGSRGRETVVGVHDLRTEQSDELWSSVERPRGFRYPEGLFLYDGKALRPGRWNAGT